MTTARRVAKDIVSLNLDANDTKLFIVDQITNTQDINVIILGPDDTPYEGGLFWINLVPSDRYPFDPPKGTFMSPVSNLRVHPNLYCEGKICLSILGTWQGPKWSSILNLSSVVLSIQSILCDNPIINEPGCEQYTLDSPISKSYNLVVKYTTLKMIVNFINNKYSISDYLKTKVIEYIKENLKKYNKLFEAIKDVGMINTSHDIRYYGLQNINLDFKQLYQEWIDVFGKLDNKDTLIEVNTTQTNMEI